MIIMHHIIIMQQLQKDLYINLTKCKKKHFCNKISFVIFFFFDIILTIKDIYISCSKNKNQFLYE